MSSAQSEVPDAIDCPRCGWKSFNHGDIEHRYCKRCREFHDQMGAPADAARARAVQWLRTVPRHVLLRITEYPFGRYRLDGQVVVLYRHNESGQRVKRCATCDVLVLTEDNPNLARSRFVSAVPFDRLTPFDVNERVRGDALVIARERQWVD